MCGFDCPNRLYLNRPEGGGRVLVESANDLGVDFIGASIVGTFTDYDRDGDLDLFLVTNRLPAPDSLLNEPFSLSHDWLTAISVQGHPRRTVGIVITTSGMRRNLFSKPTGYFETRPG